MKQSLSSREQIVILKNNYTAFLLTNPNIKIPWEITELKLLFSVKKEFPKSLAVKSLNTDKVIRLKWGNDKDYNIIVKRKYQI